MSELLNIPAAFTHPPVPQVAIWHSNLTFYCIPEKLRYVQHFLAAIETISKQRKRFLDYYVVLEVKESRTVIKFLRRDLLGAADRMRENCVLIHFMDNKFITYKELYNGNAI